MFFEVNITPKAKTSPVHEDPETNFELLLAPFQPQTHVRIETALNTTASCLVSLKNRSNRSLSVQITKTPPPERLVQLSLEKLKIDPQEDVQLVVSWTAKKPGTFRDLIQLTDSRRIKYDVALTTATTSLKKNLGRGGKSHVSEPKKVLAQNTSPNVIKKPENLATKYEGKENIASWQTPKKSRQDRDFSSLIESDSFTFTPPQWIKSEEDARLSRTSQELRRETYVTGTKINEDTCKGFEDSLSPKASQSSDFSNLIDDLKFTPAVVKHEAKSPDSTRNDTFEVVKSAEIEKHRIVPTRLSRSFARLSPVMPVVEESIRFTSSSPICGSEASNSRKRNTDVSSVQEVLEADLWAKPAGQFTFRTGAASLESISEETAKTPVSNKTYVKTQDDNQSRKTPIRKISPKKLSKITKDRSVLEIQGLKKKASMNAPLKSGGRVSIPGVRITKLSLSGVSRPRKFAGGSENEAITKLHDPDNFFTIFCNPDPFAATTTEDPFLARTLYYDDKWVSNQEIEFKKWLNALLTPPEHLTSNVDAPVADVAKIWQSCRLKEDVSLAETKEAVSARYHTNHRLDALRRAACTMLRSDTVVAVLSRVTVCIEKGNLVIRQDRDLHKDIGLQKLVLELLLCYNPLWLRIALEAIYGETIPLSSNNDIIRLSKFLLSRFFSDPFIVKTHSHQTVSNLRLPTFLGVMNKFMLKKFLFIVYFLDYAKTNKLIGHDPCLFHKQAAHKESKRILLKFSQELLSGVGDVTRVLKPYGYVLTHKQTEIDEYSYAVDNLSQDLRDGVRLCRVMELITGKKNLTSICRVPAISRLQKVYNVDLALKALTSSDYVICGNITAKSIADGHREMTLSLLWQIIYKFQAPLFNNAALTLQKWWRAKLWWVRVKNFLLKRKNDAACVIQRAWRSYRAKKELESRKKEYERILTVRNQAASFIQRNWRARKEMITRKREFERLKSAAPVIQRFWRNRRATKPFVESLRRKQNAALVIQRRWKATRAMRLEFSLYSKQREAIVEIQTWWKQKLVQKRARDHYLALQNAAKVVQTRWRSKKLAETQHLEYLTKIKAARTIQEWWRRQLTYRKDLNTFLITKDAVRTIEKWWLAHSAMAEQRTRAAIVLQQRWRALKAGREQRQALLEQRKAAVFIQSHWRNRTVGLKTRRTFVTMKAAAVCVQRRFRANKLAKEAREEFISLKLSVVVVQQRWRALKAGREQREVFLEQRRAAIVIQSHWRSCEIGLKTRSTFVALRAAAICFQRRFRANKLAKEAREEFIRLKVSVVVLQRRWRALKAGREQREAFLEQRRSAIVIQSHWRSRAIGLKTRSNFVTLKAAVVCVQRRFRTNKTREEFIRLKLSVIVVQRRWRALKAGREQRQAFLEQRKAAIIIQSHWRSRTIGLETRRTFVTLKAAAFCIQKRFWANKLGKKAREEFIKLKLSVVAVQQRWRAKKLGALVKQEFDDLRNRVLWVQRRWRANRAMRLCRKEYESKRRAASTIQTWRRATIEGRICRVDYLKLQIATIRIQRWYRELRLREFYRLRIASVLTIQNWWREILANREETERKRVDAATIIQALWKGYKTRQAQSEQMTQLRERAKKAAMDAIPSETLGHRLNVAIIILQEYEDLGRLTQGLTALDTITHLLPLGCVSLCKAGLVPKLYDLIHRSNRSRPWMDICLRASSILVSIAKYSQTKSYAWQEQFVEALIRLLSATVEKETSVFLNTATLLWLLADTPERARAIAESPMSARSFSTMYKTVEKKKPVSSRQSMGQRSGVTIQKLPNPKPDWGLSHSRPRLFVSVHHAVLSLCKRLKIKPQ